MNVKRINIGLVTYFSLFLAASSVQAQELVTAPSLDGGVTASIGTFFVTPSADNESYALTGEPNQVSVLNINPDYEFGVDATIGYIFDETANGIELSFRNINTSDTDSSEGFIPEARGAQEEDGFFDSNLGYELNSLDLTISQFMDVGNHMQMRFIGGLAYVELEQEQKTSFLQEDETTDYFEDESEFNGFGPRLGIDARYDLSEKMQGFGIVAGGSVAYYLGDLDLHHTFTSASIDDNTAQISSDADNHSVTNLRGNLGFDYVYFLDNQDRSTIGLELGYQVDYYADAVGTIESIENPHVESLATTFSGPYLSLKGAF